MKKVLIVAYSFPPVGGAGVQRPVKFVKYLRRFGWEPVILTALNPSVPVFDEALLKDIPDSVKIYKAKTLEPSYRAKQSFVVNDAQKRDIKSFVKKLISAVIVPDLQVLWWPGLIVKLFQVAHIEKPDCIYVTAPPFSSFVPVVIIGKILRIPVILDYRDEWSFARNNLENSSRSRYATFMDLIMEKLALNMCHAFTTATQSYIDGIYGRYSEDNSNKGIVITNGYDVDDFICNDMVKTNGYNTDPIRILYTGTVWKATSLSSFCAAVNKLILDFPEYEDKIKIVICGRIVESEQHYLNELIVKGIVECRGYVEHDQVVLALHNADALLLTLSDLLGAEKIITGKVFEYMATGKYIIAIVPKGETYNILYENYDNMVLVTPEESDSIYLKMKDILTNIHLIRQKTGRKTSQFSRENLTCKLALLLEKVVMK